MATVAGGCVPAAVQARVIRPDRGGLGTIRLVYPVAAALAAQAKGQGRLFVGFSRAVIRILEAAPMRCFKSTRVRSQAALRGVCLQWPLRPPSYEGDVKPSSLQEEQAAGGKPACRYCHHPH